MWEERKQNKRNVEQRNEYKIAKNHVNNDALNTLSSTLYSRWSGKKNTPTERNRERLRKKKKS